MTEDASLNRKVDEFIREEIDTVPHLEALLLLWNSRPRQWSVEEMAQALYVSSGNARHILHGLTRRKLISASRNSESFGYESDSGARDTLIRALDTIYRRELIRISRMIHSKGTPAVWEFAQAFRFTKDRE